MAENFYQETVEAPKTAFDLSLRPPLFSEFQGQTRVRERLELMVQAAKQRGDVLEHGLRRAARPDWERPPWPISARIQWESTSRRLAVR